MGTSTGSQASARIPRPREAAAASVDGFITDRGDPAAGVAVRLFDLDGHRVGSTSTDISGYFLLNTDDGVEDGWLVTAAGALGEGSRRVHVSDGHAASLRIELRTHRPR